MPNVKQAPEVLLPALRIVDALNSYKDEVGDFYPEKNLLPAWVLHFDLRLEVLRPWPSSALQGQTDVVELWCAEPGGKSRLVQKTPLKGPIEFPLMLLLEKKHLLKGESSIYFRVHTHDDHLFVSEPTSFTVDKRTPLSGATPPKPIIDEELSNGPGVTHDYLETHCSVVQLTVEHYADQRLGDYITVHCGGPNAPIVTSTVVRQSEGSTLIAIPGQFFRSLSDTAHLLYYTLSSRAGSQSVNSKGTFIRVALAPKAKKT